jgi:hypothetical protein
MSMIAGSELRRVRRVRRLVTGGGLGVGGGGVVGVSLMKLWKPFCWA